MTFFDEISSIFASLGVVWGWILGIFPMIFKYYIEKCDFAKISVSPRREHDFQGFELLKINGKSLTNRCQVGVGT